MTFKGKFTGMIFSLEFKKLLNKTEDNFLISKTKKCVMSKVFIGW